MSAYTIILHCHSMLRYFALLLLILAIAKSLKGVIQKSDYSSTDLKLGLMTMATFHTQFLLGIWLYGISPKVQFVKAMFQIDILRFFTLEHSSLMIVSIALITIGYIRAKRAKEKSGHLQIFIFYFISLLIVLWAIPWPYKAALASRWF
jgi:hypothetical protein